MWPASELLHDGLKLTEYQNKNLTVVCFDLINFVIELAMWCFYRKPLQYINY